MKTLTLRISLALASILLCLPAYAAGVDASSKIEALKNTIEKVLTPAGGIIILVGVVFFGKAFAGQDPKGKTDAIMIIVAGVIIAGAASFI